MRDLKERIYLRDSEPMRTRRFPALALAGIGVWIIVIKGTLLALNTLNLW